MGPAGPLFGAGGAARRHRGSRPPAPSAPRPRQRGVPFKRNKK